MEQQIELLIMSYGLAHLMEENDVTEEYVLELLIEEGKVNLEEYFDYD